MQKFWKKYREIITYLFFGVMTTVVGLGTYFLILAAARALGVSPDAPVYNGVRVAAQIIQWVLSVLFAYFVNRKFVFCAEKANEAKRMTEFFAARLFSLGADSLVTFGTVFVLGLTGYQSFSATIPVVAVSVNFTPDFWGKAAAAVVVIVLNYLLSKFIVFKKGKTVSQ